MAANNYGTFEGKVFGSLLFEEPIHKYVIARLKHELSETAPYVFPAAHLHFSVALTSRPSSSRPSRRLRSRQIPCRSQLVDDSHRKLAGEGVF